MGDKNLFLGEVIEAYADEALAKGEKNIAYAKGDFPRKIYAKGLEDDRIAVASRFLMIVGAGFLISNE